MNTREAPTDEQIAWGLLHCLRLPSNRVSDIVARGGPGFFLEQEPAQVLAQMKKLRVRSHDEPLPHKEQWASYEQSLQSLINAGAHIIGGADRASLGRFRAMKASPLCLYAKGETTLLDRGPLIGIVGSRRPTKAGLQHAFQLGRALGAEGSVVVSGGAYGIDMAAHQGAAAGHGYAIIVVGEPVTKEGHIGSKRVQRLAATFAPGRSLTLTPHGPATKMSRRLFVSRNRLVTAMVDALIVVEGYPQSGTLYTAKNAREMGCPLWAIPGPAQEEASYVPNLLIERGWARPWTGFAQAFCMHSTNSQCLKRNSQMGNKEHQLQVQAPHDSLGHGKGAPAKRKFAQSTPAHDPPVDTHLVPMWQYLKRTEGPVALDQLAADLALDAQSVFQQTLELEIKGYLSREGGLIRSLARSSLCADAENEHFDHNEAL